MFFLLFRYKVIISLFYNSLSPYGDGWSEAKK